MTILQKLEQQALEQCNQMEPEKLRIDNIILAKSLYTMAQCEHVFTDMNMCLVLLENGYGFSYFHDEITYKLQRFVNKRIAEVLASDMPHYFHVALIDAMYSLINKEQREKSDHRLVGSLRQKAAKRAELLLQGLPEGSNILLLGAVSEIIEEARRKAMNINVLDLQPQKIGLQIGTKTVDEGHPSLMEQHFQSADYAIVSGMAFATQTADEVFEAAERNKTELIFFMETGANFGQQLTRYGAYRVLSEYFPFYDFCGDTKYDVFEKEQK